MIKLFLILLIILIQDINSLKLNHSYSVINCCELNNFIELIKCVNIYLRKQQYIVDSAVIYRISWLT